jgi:hypothetical protein
MAKRKIAAVESAGEKRIAGLKAKLNDLLGDAPPITPNEMGAALSRRSVCPAGVSLSATPGGIGIYPNRAPIKDIPHLIEWLEDVRRLIADSRRPELLLPHSHGVLKDGYRWRLFFTQTGSIPDLSAVTTTEMVESRLVDLIDDLKKGLPPNIPEPISPVPEDDGKPAEMPTGPLRSVMEKIIITLRDNQRTNPTAKCSADRIAGLAKPRQTNNSQLRTALRQLRLPPYELLSPQSGRGYYLNDRGIRVYEQLEKDRAKKSPQKMKSH